MKTYKLNVSLGYDFSFLKRINWWPFVAGIIIGCTAATFSHLGIIPTRFLNPLPVETTILDTVRPKLKERVDAFRLKKQTSLVPQVAAGNEYDNASAYAVVDYDTGEVIGEKSLSKRLSIASLTKLMTAVVALDLSQPEDIFVVSRTAARKIPTKIGVVPGERMTLNELLHASLMTSANDATEVIREGIDVAYGSPVFIQAMNEKAKIMGLTNTHFTNPQGFDDEEHYSSVEDMTILTHYALTNYPLIAEIVKKDYVFLPQDKNHKQFDLYNWNGLLGVYPNVMGVKIGNTDDAGVTTIVLSERDGKRVIAVLLGASDILKRDLWSSQLLDAGFAKTGKLEPVEVKEEDLAAKYASWQTWN